MSQNRTEYYRSTTYLPAGVAGVASGMGSSVPFGADPFSAAGAEAEEGGKVS